MAFRTKHWLPLLALVVVSVIAGIVISAELGLTTESKAQTPQEITVDADDVQTTMVVPSFADVAERVMPAVVSIRTTELVSRQEQRGMDPFDFFFRGPQPDRGDSPFDDREQISGGSGFIITSNGYILTNNHVVQDASRVMVRLGDEDREYQAEVIGRDAATDIALIKIDAEGLPTVKLGDSDRVRIGEWALAIGNPVGFENTLTVGVVSAKGRALGLSQESSSFENFIQTDAAINFGNSGGPLLNIRGEVIGINTAIRAYAQNLGFATPVNVAKRIYPVLREEGRVVRGYLGVSIGNITPQERRAFNLESRDGALVQQVTEGQPAADAGLQRGDVIIAVDGRKIDNTRTLIDYVSSQRPGETVTLTVIREGRERTIDVELGERPDFSVAEDTGRPSLEPTQERLGLAVRELDATTRRQFGISRQVDGLIVIDVRGLSPASDAGLAPGDVITEVNGRPIGTIADFRRVVESAESGDLLRLYVTRSFRSGQSTSSFAIIEVP